MFWRTKPKEVEPKNVFVSLAWKDLSHINEKIVEDYALTCNRLDLTNNHISVLDPLRSFQKLESLILDGNKITERTTIPRLESLTTLWVNRNKISNLSLFITQIESSLPNLKHLSMLNNDACPNYFNGGKMSQYRAYRIYVIQHLPKLIALDDTYVTKEEREESLSSSKELASLLEFEEKQRVELLEAKRKREKTDNVLKLQERKRKNKEIQLKKKENEKLSQLLPKLDLNPPAPPTPTKDIEESDEDDVEEDEEFNDHDQSDDDEELNEEEQEDLYI